MFFALQRLGGLRRAATRTLPWRGMATDSWGAEHVVGIDWRLHRIRVVGNCKATEHPLRYREVPISPLLYQLLPETYEASPARFGCPDVEAQSISGVGLHNLIRLAKRIRIKAQLEPWPKMYKSLRVSAEQDWKLAGISESTYTVWAGHSVSVSRKHYVSPLASEFDAIAKVA